MEIDLPVGKLILCTHNEHFSFGEAFFRSIDGKICSVGGKDEKACIWNDKQCTDGGAQGLLLSSLAASCQTLN